MALCLVHLLKEYPLLQEVDSTLLGLWKLFEYSPKKLCVFKRVQEVYGQKPLVLIRAATTRWLTHLHACLRVCERFGSIVNALDVIYTEKKEPEVFGLRHNLTRKEIMGMVILLCDILKPINFLNLYLQEENVNFTKLSSRVETTVEELHRLISNYKNSNFAETAFERGQEVFDEITDSTDLRLRLRGDASSDSLSIHSFLQHTGIPFVYSLISEVEDAFRCSPLLSAFGFLDPRNAPDCLDELGDYGSVSYSTIRLHLFFCILSLLSSPNPIYITVGLLYIILN